MFKKKSVLVTLFVCALVLLVGGYFILANVQRGQAQVRTVTLEKDYLCDQAILNEFEDAKVTVEDSVAEFEGYKNIDPAAFTELDNLSAEEKKEMAEGCKVKYNFTYDSANNLIIISAEMKNEYGEVNVDKIEGTPFYNEEGEVDAVMNIDGEGVLLSEMRAAGMIENCGWFSRLIKKVVAVVAVVAATVAVAAAVVVTCGAAAPAFVAAGVGAIATVTGASVAAIGLASALTAMIASGVYIAADIWERYYPGIGAATTTTSGVQVVTAQWSKEKTKTALRDIVRSETGKPNPKVFFHVTKLNNCNGPVQVELTPYTKGVMATNMRALSWSSITAEYTEAWSVIQTAFCGYPIIEDKKGMPHFHALLPSGQHARGNNGLYTVHSFYSGLIA